MNKTWLYIQINKTLSLNSEFVIKLEANHFFRQIASSNSNKSLQRTSSMLWLFFWVCLLLFQQKFTTLYLEPEIYDSQTLALGAKNFSLYAWRPLECQVSSARRLSPDVNRTNKYYRPWIELFLIKRLSTKVQSPLNWLFHTTSKKIIVHAAHCLTFAVANYRQVIIE